MNQPQKNNQRPQPAKVVSVPPDKSAPYSEPAEAATLGAVLVEPTLFLILQSKVKTDHFFILRHRYIWEAFERIARRDDKIDLLTVAHELAAMGRFNDVGDAYLTQLVMETPNWQMAEVYAGIVSKTYTRRQMLKFRDYVTQAAHDESIDVSQAIANVEGQWQATVLSDAPLRRATSLSAAVEAVWNEQDKRQEGEPPSVLTTGFKAIDQRHGGIPKDTLMLLAARPGMGKSSLATSIGLKVAEQKKRVLFISTELKVKAVTARVLAIKSGVIPANDIMYNKLRPEHYEVFVDTAGKVDGLPFYIEYQTILPVGEMIGMVSRQYFETGLDLVICDGLYGMVGNGQQKDNRKAEINYIEEQINEKIIARFGVPVILTHQLKRDPDERQDHRPLMSDLEYGGEQLTDMVCLLYRDSVYNDATEFPNQADLIFAKNRNGTTGVVSMYFDRLTTAFMDGAARRINLNDLDYDSDRE